MVPPTQAHEAKQRLGEVVETSSTGFTVHCYRLYEAPPLGALVRTTGESPVYAVAREVSTSSVDPGRRPVALGRDEQDEEAVYRSNPQLPRLLRTDFKATMVGYRDADGIRQHLPPTPPNIHAFIHACTPEEAQAFTERLDFLPLLFADAGPIADEVTAAFLRQTASAHDNPDAFLTDAGRQLARLLSRDLQRLSRLLRGLRP